MRCWQSTISLAAATGFFLTAPIVVAGPWFDGGDLSALAEMESLGARFLDKDGAPCDAIRSLASFGANCVRLRIFVEPDGRRFVVNDSKYTLTLAKRAKAAGQKILLDFHYSDTWADPGAQSIPKSWTDQSLAALSERVESHTYDVLRTFDEQGVLPELVQIGNEIDNGMLWPTGHIFRGKDQAADWDSVSTLLKAAARGVRRATPDGSKAIRIVLHTAAGGDTAKCDAYHRAMRERGLDYDVAGLSYYPWWHGGLDGLKQNARQLATVFGKEVFVVEAAFPWNEGTAYQEFHNRKFEWPATPAGQQAYLRDVIDVIHQLPGNKGIGVMWWHPDSLALPKARVWMNGSCALWQADGKPLPATQAFGLY